MVYGTGEPWAKFAAVRFMSTVEGDAPQLAGGISFVCSMVCVCVVATTAFAEVLGECQRWTGSAADEGLEVFAWLQRVGDDELGCIVCCRRASLSALKFQSCGACQMEGFADISLEGLCHGVGSCRCRWKSSAFSIPDGIQSWSPLIVTNPNTTASSASDTVTWTASGQISCV